MIAGMLFSCDKTESPVVVEKPAVSVEDLVVDECNTDHVIEVKLKLSAPSQNNIVLRYSTKDVTATAGSDYVALTDMSTVKAVN